jgi:hypothetical protein
VPTGADETLDIGFHQDLQHCLRHRSQEIAVAALLQQLGQRHSVVGHRVLGQLGVKSRNSTLAGLPGRPPSAHARAELQVLGHSVRRALYRQNFHRERGR